MTSQGRTEGRGRIVELSMLLCADLLDVAADEFSNHGCNDLDPEWFKDWTDTDKEQLANLMNESNGTQSDSEDRIKFQNIQDWMLFRFLADMLRQRHQP